MDSGCLEPGETLEPDYDLSKTLSASQVMGIMDQLLASETAWQQGHSLAQTVFTSLYIDKLLWPVPRLLTEATFCGDTTQSEAGELVHVVLRAYCCAVVKSCDLIQAQVTSEQYYEEEDFSAHLYRRELLTRTPVAEIVELLNTAEAIVECEAGIDPPVKEALIRRLELRQNLLLALSAEVPTGREQACSAWETCRKLIYEVKKSSGYGTPVPEAFSEKVQRKLASSTPPRPVVVVSLEEAVEHVAQMCVDAKDVFGILDSTTATSVVTFLITYMMRKPQPNVYVRCLAQALVYKDSTFLGRMSNQGFVFRDLMESVLGDSILVDEANEAAEAPQSSRFQIASAMNTFANATSNSLADLIRCLCMNRSRMRRMLTHTLNDWENLQFEAEDVDVRLQPHTGEKPLIDRLSAGEEIWSYPLSSWVYTYKLKQMEWIIQLGFELDVYMPDELPAMYWYLRYLADTRYQHLHRIRAFTKRSMGFIKKPTAQQLTAFKQTLEALEFAASEAAATVSFAQALCCLYQALCLSQLIPPPSRPYGSDDFRHNLRLKPFLNVSLPPTPSKADMKDSLEDKMELASLAEKDRYSRVYALLDSADGLIKSATKDWSSLSKQAATAAQCIGCERAWRQKTKDILKSVVFAGITVANVRKAVSKAGDNPIKDVKVDISNSRYHDWWLVPVLKTE